MSDSDTGVEVNSPSASPVLRAYGGAGDVSGARRNRRAFRWCVSTVVVFTGVLYFCEGFLRYDRTETQYLSALTLQDSSARAILRNVVKQDSALRQVPTAQYVEALAGIEEEDVLFERYEEAYRLNRNSASLSINYGCRLFEYSQYLEARERFREASIQPQKNALPRYLEAAALAASTLSEEDLGEALALIARTNNSGLPLIFPAPLWHASLPTSGQWYMKLRRSIADRCCAPLYRFKNIVVGHATTQLAAGKQEHWEAWLGELDILGARLIGDVDSPRESAGIPQAMAGIEFQLEALELRRMIASTQKGGDGGALGTGGGSDAILERRIRLNTALETLQEFEDRRKYFTDQHESVLRFPMYLCLKTTIGLFGIYFILFLIGKVSGVRKQYWTLPHTKLGVGVISASLLTFLLLLIAISGLGGAVVSVGDEVAIRGVSDLAWISYLWGFIFVVLLFFGIFYPALTLVSVEDAVSELGARNTHGEESALGDVEELLPVVRRSRRHAAIALIRRYYGIVLGGFLCVVCVWVIGYRVVVSLYPMQLALLTSGLEEQELAMIRQVQEFLVP